MLSFELRMSVHRARDTYVTRRKSCVGRGVFEGLAGKDLSKVPFAVDVTFEGPRVPRLAGREAVVGFLTMILPAIKDVRIGQHLVEGDYVATTFDMVTNIGIDRVFDRICIADGEIRSIRSFYYSQPLPT